MIRFAEVFPDRQIVSALMAQLGAHPFNSNGAAGGVAAAGLRERGGERGGVRSCISTFLSCNEKFGASQSDLKMRNFKITSRKKRLGPRG